MRYFDVFSSVQPADFTGRERDYAKFEEQFDWVAADRGTCEQGAGAESIGGTMTERPQVIRTTHILPFEGLSPLDFERLCLWLVRREGYERAEHLGAAGGEQGRDIVAWRNGRRVVFQCKRVERLDSGKAGEEFTKLRSLPEKDQPAEMVFVVSSDVSALVGCLER